MNREIKFRAWDTAYKIMFYTPLECRTKGSLGIDKYACWGNVMADTAFEVMQFTGLTDKNSKEIYEGDIVRFYLDNREYRLPVIFKDSMFMVKKESREFLIGNFRPDDLEVIGNIFENKDLLL